MALDNAEEILALRFAMSGDTSINPPQGPVCRFLDAKLVLDWIQGRGYLNVAHKGLRKTQGSQGPRISRIILNHLEPESARGIPRVEIETRRMWRKQIELNCRYLKIFKIQHHPGPSWCQHLCHSATQWTSPASAAFGFQASLDPQTRRQLRWSLPASAGKPSESPRCRSKCCHSISSNCVALHICATARKWADWPNERYSQAKCGTQAFSCPPKTCLWWCPGSQLAWRPVSEHPHEAMSQLTPELGHRSLPSERPRAWSIEICQLCQLSRSQHLQWRYQSIYLLFKNTCQTLHHAGNFQESNFNQEF